MTDSETGWFYEAGIGENRAILLEQGVLVAARLERHGDGAKAGAIVDAKFQSQWVAGRSGIIALETGEEVLLQPLPKGLTEGAIVRVEIVREAMAERGGQSKRAKAKPVSGTPSRMPAPQLLEDLNITKYDVRQVHPHDDDIFAQYGWHDALEQADSGLVAFDGGNLLISLTPAMTVIDVDGPLPPLELAKRAAGEIARALSRLQLTGSIAVDFPTLQSKADRNAVCAIFDEQMTGNCERTAINGFGLMQIVSRKVRPSIAEIIQSDRVLAATLDLLRQAERDRGTGVMCLRVHPAVAVKLEDQPSLVEQLSKRVGRSVAIEAKGTIAINGGQVSSGD